MRRLSLLVLVACSSPAKPIVQPSPVPRSVVERVAPDLNALRENAIVGDFKVLAVYRDDADHPVGAKLVHVVTGFQLDYLKIESAPQGYIWVKTYPTSDRGEPHTQEHLLLGKGDRGRALGSSQAMSLAKSSAFTEQWHTAYHFHTVAGPDAYWSVFENELDALLHPDYTDEEIRREVRNFGVDDGHLEEKGTVYNEMVRDYEVPETIVGRAINQLVYGAKHPLALEAGGFPAAIRTMTPADIRSFHASHYHLANMGIIAAYPSSMPLATVLDHTAKILERAHDTTPVPEVVLPRPQSAAPGTIAIEAFPDPTATSPGRIMYEWPATRSLDPTERMLLGLFIDAFAGDETTPLYKQVIDSKTRTIDLGATKLTAKVSGDQGQPVSIAIDGVKADKIDQPTLAAVRKVIASELDRLAKLPDGDPELVAFDQRVQARVVSKRRELAAFLDAPPRFGERGTDQKWFIQLRDVVETPAKSLTMKPTLAAIETILAARANPWRERIHTWQLDVAPYAAGAKPNAELREQMDQDRDVRIATELTRLQGEYKTTTAAETLARYQADYAAVTPIAKAAELPPLVATPPTTLDDSLVYETGELDGVRTFAATFNSMQSVRWELSFDLAHAVAPDDQMYLAALPDLLRGAGVDETGLPGSAAEGQRGVVNGMSATEMNNRVRNEVLALEVSYIGNTHTQRSELMIAGQGLGVAEGKNALAWIRRVALAPDWRIENLPRLRDIVEQGLQVRRTRMLDEEEKWVNDPRDAWWLQDAVQAHTASFLTQEFDLHRLRWMLEDPRDPKLQAAGVAMLRRLATQKSKSRAQLVALTAQLAVSKDPIEADAGKELGAVLADVPDDSLARDWEVVTLEMASDLAFGAPAALAKLAHVRAQLVTAPRARIVETSSSATREALATDMKALVDALPATESKAADPAKNGIRARLAARLPAAAHAMYVGLLAPSTSSGVFDNVAPATQFSDDNVLDYLASNLYTGHGAHSMFMKTWAAGLAYSNGLHPWIADGYIDYYAERCPLLPQTIRFVIDQLRNEKPNPNIARYAIAGAFDSRIADRYERRAAAMAANLVDGIPPDLVRAFRTRVLEQSKRDDLAKDLYARMPVVYAKVLPGLGAPAPDAINFVIGNAKQLAAYQDYLHAAVGKTATLFTLYPRDFWLP
jgi:Zn-dependent M16 (insulinase) family peptidase